MTCDNRLVCTMTAKSKLICLADLSAFMLIYISRYISTSLWNVECSENLWNFLNLLELQWKVGSFQGIAAQVRKIKAQREYFLFSSFLDERKLEMNSLTKNRKISKFCCSNNHLFFTYF